MKNKYAGYGCGCLLWIVLLLIIISLIGSCTNKNQLQAIKGSDEVIAASTSSCSFGPFVKEFYKLSLNDEKVLFETSLKDNEFQWCGTLIDIKESKGKYYFFVTAYKRHFTGQPWDIFKVKHTNRLPYVVRVETVEDFPVNKFNPGDYISFKATLKERGVNETGNKRYWEMAYGRDFGLNKQAKKQRKSTYYKEILKRERQEQKEAEERRKANSVDYSDDEVEDVEEVQETKATTPKHYKNCSELRSDYTNGVKKGEAAYDEKMDRDKDGVACEPYNR